MSIKKHDFFQKYRLNGIPGIRRAKQVRHIQGLSPNQKYYIRSKAGQEFLLVLDDISELSRLEKEAEWINYLTAQDIPTNRLLDLGTCNGGQNVYMMLTWIPGVDIESTLKSCDVDTCVKLGKKAGRLLRQIHSLVPLARDIHSVTITDTISECLLEFSSDNMLIQKYPSMSYFIHFLENCKDFSIDSERHSILHGDYHTKNLIYSEGTLSAIDWVYGTVGNPIEDFVRNVISGISSPIFASAQIDSYFEGVVPDLFWQVLAIYTAIHELRITKYVFLSPEANTTFVDYQHRLVLAQYDDMRSRIPVYFRKV